MSDFKAKMHQIRFRLGLRPRHRWGAYSAHPDPLAGFKGAYTSKRREVREGKGEREGKERVRKKERGGKGKREGTGKRSLALILQFDHTGVTKFAHCAPIFMLLRNVDSSQRAAPSTHRILVFNNLASVYIWHRSVLIWEYRVMGLPTKYSSTEATFCPQCIRSVYS